MRRASALRFRWRSLIGRRNRGCINGFVDNGSGAARFHHAGKAQRLVQIGFGIETVARCDVVKGFEPGAQQRLIDGCRTARVGGAFEEDLHLHVATGNSFADGRAQRRFHRVKLHGHVEMEVETAMIHGLNRERKLARCKGARHTGKAGHAANGHDEGVFRL